jgi:hypothetical protein
VLNGFIVAPDIPERLGQSAAGPHVGTGFQQAPEMADILLECRRTYRFLTGFQALLVQLNRFRRSFRRFLGEQNVGIGAKWGAAQGLLRQGDTLPLVGSVQALYMRS